MMRTLAFVALVVGCKAPSRHAAHDDLPPAPPATVQPTDDNAFPSERAAIEYGIQGGYTGEGQGLAEVWSDGTVRFSGGNCFGKGTKKATVPAARVTALLDALDRSGLFGSSAKPTRRMADGFTTRLRVAAHGRSIMLTDDEKPSDEYVREAGRLIDEVVGPNPCR